MTEFESHIAEVEGIRTPTRNRSKKEIAAAFDEHTKIKKAKKLMKRVPTKTPKPTPAKSADAKPAPKFAEPIEMCFVSATGYVREVGYDAKTKLFYVGFAKSTWAMPSSKKEWDAVERAIADGAVNFDSYYRTAFRGRTPLMLPVRSEVSK